MSIDHACFDVISIAGRMTRTRSARSLYPYILFRCVFASLYEALSVRPSVGRSVTLSSNAMKNGLIWIVTVLDEEERGTRRKEEQGGRRDE